MGLDPSASAEVSPVAGAVAVVHCVSTRTDDNNSDEKLVPGVSNSSMSTIGILEIMFTFGTGRQLL